MPSHLHQRIRHLRNALGKTQEAFGAELGVSKAAVSMWESTKATKRTEPTLDNLRAIAALCQAKIGWLADDSSDLDSSWQLQFSEIEAPAGDPQPAVAGVAAAIAEALRSTNASRRDIAADIFRRLAADPNNGDLVKALADMLTEDDVQAERAYEFGKHRPAA